MPRLFFVRSLFSEKGGAFTHPKQSSDTGFGLADLMPGDWTWMQNPYYDGTAVGEEGSNGIYAGGGLFVDYNGSFVRDLRGLQQYIFDAFKTVPTSARLSEFQIKRIYRPKVPDFCR